MVWAWICDAVGTMRVVFAAVTGVAGRGRPRVGWKQQPVKAVLRREDELDRVKWATIRS